MKKKTLQEFTPFGTRVEVYRSLNSTQKRARRIFADKKEEALIISSGQTEGEGRRGRRWQSPEGGLYFSLIIKDNPDSFLSASIKALLAALKAAEKQEVAMEWKWPNDLTNGGKKNGGKKIGGILCEKPEPGWIIAGFGINTGIKLNELPGSLQNRSAVCDIKRGRFVEDLIGLFKKYMPLKKLSGEIKEYLEERLELKGENIIVGLYEGMVLGIENDGSIKLDVKGDIKKISHGSPEVLNPPPNIDKNIVVIDIGNSSARIGYAAGGNILKAADIVVEPEKTFPARLVKQARELIVGRSKPDAVGLSSVTDRVRKSLINKLEVEFDLKVSEVNRDNCAGLKLDISKNTVVGADRLANAVAVRDYYGGPAIVVDLGTANTFDVIDPIGVYLGGVISPGIESMKDALVARADKIGNFKNKIPAAAIGKDTLSCLNSGFYYTLTGQINEILSQLKKEIDGNFKIIFTGGGIKTLNREYLQDFIVDPDITLKGLVAITG